MKRKLLLASIAALSCGYLHSQTLYVPGGTGGIANNTSNTNVGIGTSNPQYKLDVIGGDTRFDDNYKLYIPSMGSSYFWKGIDNLDNVRWSVWDKLTLYNPTTAGLNTNNSGWNIQFGARDGSINARGSAYFATSMGNVGIGTSNPQSKLDVRGDAYINSGIDDNHIYWGNHYMTLGTKPGDYAHNILSLKPGGASEGRLYTVFNMFNANSTTSFDLKIQMCSEGNSFFNGGNVLIGKTTQTNSAYKLDVAGKIRADEVVVNTTGADFVFEPAYQLMSLNELETYLKANRHLPGIATAAEMQENGVSSGEMQTKLLQKVEELTLYVIELKKDYTQLQIKNQEQEKEISELKNKINETKGLEN